MKFYKNGDITVIDGENDIILSGNESALRFNLGVDKIEVKNMHVWGNGACSKMGFRDKIKYFIKTVKMVFAEDIDLTALPKGE